MGGEVIECLIDLLWEVDSPALFSLMCLADGDVISQH